MKFLIAAACLPVAILVGCGSPESSDNPPAEKSEKTGSVQTPKKKKAPPKLPLEKRTYGGQTIAEWQVRLKNIDPKGPDGKAAVDGLVALLQDTDVPLVLRHRAALKLGRIGQPAESAVPVFVELIKQSTGSDDSDVQRAAFFSIKALEYMGPAARPAVKTLIEVTTDSKRDVLTRAGAMEALARIGTADSEAVRTVIAMLTHSRHPGVSPHDHMMLKRLAADCIAIIGPAASSAIPKLIQQSRSNDAELRRKCIQALGTMKGSRDVILPIAEALTRDDSPPVRQAAGVAMASLGPVALPALQKLLKDEDAEVRARAAEALAMMARQIAKDSRDSKATELKPALDDLDFALDDDNGWVRLYSAEAILHITGNVERAVAAYVDAFRNPRRQIRIKAYRLIQQLGPRAKPFAYMLKARVQDKNALPQERAAAVKALRAVEVSQ